MRFKLILLFFTIISAANAQFVDMRTDSLVTKVPLRFRNLNEAAGKVLTSDAIGNASWQTPSGGSGLWQQTGNYIQNTNTNGFWSSYASALPISANNISFPPTSPTSGNGTRMAWIPARSAFQGGTFNLGDGSVRFVSENVGLFSFCYGLNAESRSRGGIAMGEGAIADGSSNTIAFGEAIQVRGQRNFGAGFSNQISDGTSNTFLLGELSNATAGQHNYGYGWGLQVSGFGVTHLGSYNSPYSSSNTSWVGTDPLMVIGNGQSDLARSNALIALKDGRIGINKLVGDISSNIQKMQVSGGLLIEGGLKIPSGAVSGRYLKSDGFGNASWANMPSLILPYSGAINSTNTALEITNSSATGHAIHSDGNLILSNINEKAGRILFSVDNNGEAKWNDGACINRCSFSWTRDQKSSIPVGSIQALPFQIKTFDLCDASTLVNIIGDNDFLKFTAPMDGIYQFEFNGPIQSSFNFSIGIFKLNASNVPTTALYRKNVLGNASDLTQTFTSTLKLIAGDQIVPTIQVPSGSGSIAFNNSGTQGIDVIFSGHLIQATDCNFGTK